MKKLLKKISVFLIATTLVISGAGFINNSQVYAAEVPVAKTITATGKARVMVKPDIAIISMGVQTENTTVIKAQSENNAKMKTLIEKIKSMGIAEKDIQTAYYFISPNYDYSEDRMIIKGYSISNNLKITVRNIEKAGEIADAGLSVGANTLGGIQFGVSDTTPYYEKALSAAISNAKNKGAFIAKELGVVVDNPISIVESDISTMPMANSAISDASNIQGMGMSVEMGELEITATIEAIFGY